MDSTKLVYFDLVTGEELRKFHVAYQVHRALKTTNLLYGASIFKSDATSKYNKAGLRETAQARLKVCPVIIELNAEQVDGLLNQPVVWVRTFFSNLIVADNGKMCVKGPRIKIL
jgi:hypothetical protein